MNDEEIGLLKLKIKIQKGVPNNSAVLQNWSPKKLGHPSLICGNVKSLRKVLLNYVDCFKI